MYEAFSPAVAKGCPNPRLGMTLGDDTRTAYANCASKHYISLYTSAHPPHINTDTPSERHTPYTHHTHILEHAWYITCAHADSVRTNFKHAQSSKHLCSLCNQTLTISPDKTKQFQGRHHVLTLLEVCFHNNTALSNFWSSFGCILSEWLPDTSSVK